jgi:hypothetical protein
MKAQTSKFLFAFLVIGFVLVPVAKNFAQDKPQVPEAEAVTAEGEAATAPEGAAQAATEGEAAAGAETVSPPGAPLFTRHADAVVLKGEEVPEFAGVKEDQIRVFANKTGRLEPIPYQMDERNQWGEFVVVKGARVVLDNDDGALDENDEIVFLTRDIGMKTPKDQWPKGYKAAYEVEVTDPLTSVKAYAYVMAYESASAAPTPSPVDYVSFEPKGYWGVVHATNYELGFVKVFSGLDYDVLTVTPAAGGSGVDWFDMLKVRVTQNIRRWITLGFSPRLDKTEKNFLVKTYGYKDGPVRLVRVMKNNLQLLWKLPAPGATVNSVFYPEWIEWPVPINLPFKPSLAFRDIDLSISHDYAFKVTDGVRIFESIKNRWYDVDGKMTPAEQAWNRADGRGGYYGFDATKSGNGAGFYTVRPPKSFNCKLVGVYNDNTTYGVEPAYYKADENTKNREENIPGALPLAGGRFVEWGDVGRGIHTVFFYHFYPPFWKKQGDEKPFLDIIDHPITVTVH